MPWFSTYYDTDLPEPRITKGEYVDGDACDWVVSEDKPKGACLLCVPLEDGRFAVLLSLYEDAGAGSEGEAWGNQLSHTMKKAFVQGNKFTLVAFSDDPRVLPFTAANEKELGSAITIDLEKDRFTFEYDANGVPVWGDELPGGAEGAVGPDDPCLDAIEALAEFEDMRVGF